MKKHDMFFAEKMYIESSRKNLYVKFIMSFSVFLIVPMILLGFLWYENIVEANYKKTREVEQKSVRAVTEQIQLYREAITGDLLNMLYGTKLQSYKTFRRVDDLVDIMNDMKSIKLKNSVIYSIYLHDVAGEKIYDTNSGVFKQEDFYDKSWMTQVEDMLTMQVMYHHRNVNGKITDYNSEFTAMHYPEHRVVTLITPENAGFRFIANIDIQGLGEWLQTILYIGNKNLYIASADEILYSTLKEFDEKELDISRWTSKEGYYEYQGKEYIYFASSIDQTDLYYIESVSMEMIKRETEEYAKYVISVIGVLVAITIVLSAYVSGKMYRPYNELLERIQNVKVNYASSQRRENDWYGIKKIFNDISDNDEEKADTLKRVSYENSYMFRVLLNGIVSQSEFFDQVKESMGDDFIKKKYKIVVCRLVVDYSTAVNAMHTIRRLNEVINMHLLERIEGISVDMDYNILIIFLVNAEEEKLKRTEEFLRVMINELTNQKNHFYSSKVFHSEESIYDYYRQCICVMENFLFFEDCPGEDARQAYQIENKYKNSLGTYATAIIRGIVMCEEQVIFDKIGELEKELLDVRDKNYAQNLCVRILSELDNELTIKNVLSSDKDVIRQIYDIKTLKELKEYMLTVCIKKMEMRKSVDKSREEIYYEKAILYMQENYMKNINITDVADAVGISYVYLSKIFKGYQKDEMRMVDCLNVIRIERAVSLLEETNDTLPEIAEKVGYNNAQSLTRFFKKYKGVTPGDYRKSIKLFFE